MFIVSSDRSSSAAAGDWFLYLEQLKDWELQHS